MADYTHVNRESPEVEVFRGSFRKVRRALGTTAFGINEITMPPGFEGPQHDETDTGHEEVYIVLDGGGTATIDGEAVALAPGDYLRVGAAAVRQIVAGADGLRFIAIGAKANDGYDGRASL
ncbi:MAG: cupin domain-containing protein [Gaiellales bacterium]